MSTPQETGNRGEQLAANYLLAQGYEILHTNWRFLHLEIDIVARTADRLVICEVKTRATDAFGEPEVFVSLQKQQKLIRAAGHYIEQERLELEVRFDIISVVEQGSAPQLKHIPDAFQPRVR